MSDAEPARDIWPPCTSLLTHIAYDAGLGECSNQRQGDSLRRSIANFGRSQAQHVRSRGDHDCQDSTRIPFIVVLYQTGMHGPQNGFRLLLAEHGIAPQRAADALYEMGTMHAATAEMVYLSADGAVEVVPDVHDGHDGSREVTRKVISRLIGLGHCEWSLGVQHAEADGTRGCVARPIRESACYPLSTRKKGAAISDAAVTGRGMMLYVKPTGKANVCEGLILAKEGVSPEHVETTWLSLETRDAGRSATVTVFERDGRVLTYDGWANTPTEIRRAI